MGQRFSHSQMDRMMKRMRNAFIMGTIDRVSAETIFLRARIRPNSRITRKARMKRSTVTGMSTGPRATRDMTTTRASSMLHGLHRKGCAERGLLAGVAAIPNGQKKREIVKSSVGPGFADLQPVRVRVHGQLGREDEGEEEVRDLQRPPELSLRTVLVGEAVGVLSLDQIGDEVLPRTRAHQHLCMEGLNICAENNGATVTVA
jgi:hypothetical protein